MAHAEGGRELPGMAGVVPQRARTAGLKREEGPVCVMGRAFRRCKSQPLHAIDLPCSAGQSRTAAISQPTIRERPASENPHRCRQSAPPCGWGFAVLH